MNTSCSPSIEHLPVLLEADFLFAPHDDPVHLASLPARLEQSDVFIPETGPVFDGMPQVYQSISGGDRKAFEAEVKRLRQFDGWEGPVFLLEQIHNSNRSIAIIDLSSRSPLWRRIALGAVALQRPGMSDEQFVEAHVGFGRLQRKREDRMLESLAPAIERSTQERADLAQKPVIKALFTLGTLHTRIYHHLYRELGAEHVSRTFDGGEIPIELSLIRRGVFNLATSTQDAYDDIARRENYDQKSHVRKH